MIHSPDHASLIFMVAVGPAMVVIALMFIVRPVGGHRQVRPSDGTSFTFVYSVCVVYIEEKTKLCCCSCSRTYFFIDFQYDYLYNKKKQNCKIFS